MHSKICIFFFLGIYPLNEKYEKKNKEKSLLFSLDLFFYIKLYYILKINFSIHCNFNLKNQYEKYFLIYKDKIIKPLHQIKWPKSIIINTLFQLI